METYTDDDDDDDDVTATNQNTTTAAGVWDSVSFRNHDKIVERFLYSSEGIFISVLLELHSSKLHCPPVLQV